MKGRSVVVELITALTSTHPVIAPPKAHQDLTYYLVLKVELSTHLSTLLATAPILKEIS